MSFYPPVPGCQIPNLPEVYEQVFGQKTAGAFVEVGAFDGVNWSNTFNLARLGWRGLLFEPQPEYYARCVANYAGLKGDIENCAIGSYDGRATLYLGGSISTTIPEQVDIYNAIPWAQSCGLSHEHRLECDIFTLNTMLERHAWPAQFELLVVDVEGAEIEVFKGLDLARWQPKLIIAEAHELFPDERLNWKAGEIMARLAPFGYAKVQADTINTIYVRGSE